MPNKENKKFSTYKDLDGGVSVVRKKSKEGGEAILNWAKNFNSNRRAGISMGTSLDLADSSSARKIDRNVRKKAAEMKHIMDLPTAHGKKK